jgi:transmembrane sensor
MRLAVSTERANTIEEEASDWLIRRDSGQWTDTDQARFEQWLDASTLNRVAFLRLELAWEESARLKALGAGVAGDQPPPPGRWNVTPFFDSNRTAPRGHTEGTNDAPDSGTVTGEARQRTRRLALAASVLLAVIAGLGTYPFWSSDTDRYRTPIGGLSSVPMPDGSKVTLNTASEIRVAVNENERRIDLRRGEAFFEVAKDPNRPFVVEAGKKRVVAVGTKFSVRRDGESVEVVVTEGKVRVEDASRPLRSSAVEASGSPAPPLAADDPVFLTTGAIAYADEAGVLVHRKSLVEAETHLSWRSGVLMFRDQNLANAVAEFNRYNVRKIVIADPAVAALKVEGNFRATNVDAFVRLLESGFPVRATAEADQIVLSSR